MNILSDSREKLATLMVKVHLVSQELAVGWVSEMEPEEIERRFVMYQKLGYQAAILIVLVLALFHPAIAQTNLGPISVGAVSVKYPNGAAGTQCNKLVKLDGSGNAIQTAGGETLGIIGVAQSGCATTGKVAIAVWGEIQILFDSSSVTVGDYVGISSAAGFVTDAGSTPPSSQNIGRIIRNTAGGLPTNCNVAPASCYVLLTLGSSSGGSSSGCTGGCVVLNPAGSQTINQPPGSTLTVTAPVAVQASGAINGATAPDSGTAAQTLSTNNTAGFFSGSSPATSSCYTGGNIFQPLFSAKVSSVPYSTELEAFCNKDQLGGYPSLDSSFGLVPTPELEQNSSTCVPGTVMSGDRTGCVAGASSTHWNSVLVTGTETNSGPGVMRVGNGLTFTFDGLGGHINADLVNFANWPSAAVGGPFNNLNAIPVIVSATSGGSTFGASVPPQCVGPGCALGFNQTTHQFTSQNVALNSQHPMIYLFCNGTNDQCPNTTSVTGTGGNAILYEFTIAANQLSADGQCIHVTEQWKHSTGSAASSYAWNVGGTGSVGGAVTGGTTTATVSSTSGALFLDTLHICRADGALTTTISAEQWQLGTASGGPSSANAAIDWTQAQQINLLFNVANTDNDTFWGGEAIYP